MEFTGERMMPSHNRGNLIYGEHLVRYSFAAQFVKGKKVLDIATGVGYGAKLLRQEGAVYVCGVDISPESIEYAKNKYAGEGVEYIVGSAQDIPAEADSFDVVVSFETIEHIENHRKFLREVKRVLRDDGVFIVSTPNKKVSMGDNDFHVTELSLSEFKEELDDQFSFVEVLKQRNFVDNFIYDKLTDLKVRDISFDVDEGVEPEYFVAICSFKKVDVDYKGSSFVFLPTEGMSIPAIEESQRRLESIKNLGQRISDLDYLIREKEQLLIGQERAVGEKEKSIQERDSIIGERERAIQERDSIIGEKEKSIGELEGSICEKDKGIASLGELIDDGEQEIIGLRGVVQRGEIEIFHLRDAVNEERGEIDGLKGVIQARDADIAKLIDSICVVKGSFSYRLGRLFTFPVRIFFPVGSRRESVFKVLRWGMRHPFLFLRKASLANFKAFFRFLNGGEALEVLNLEDERPDGIVEAEVKEGGERGELDLFDGIDRGELIKFKFEEKPMVSIAIPVFNQWEHTYACLLSILKNTSSTVSYEIIIADDVSTDETRNIKNLVKNVKVVRNKENLGFLRNCNNAAKSARGKYILFLNNDTRVQKGWLKSLIDTFGLDEKIGMVGSKLVYPDGKLQEAGGVIRKNGLGINFGGGMDSDLPEFNYLKEVDYVSGASMILTRKLWDEVEGFSLDYDFAYYEDVDLAFKIRDKGYKVVYQPKSVVVHFEGVSHGDTEGRGLKKYQLENRKRFYMKWVDTLKKESCKNDLDLFWARDRSRDKKTILVIDHYVPRYDMDAGSRTMFQYLKLFVEMGFNVKFLGDDFCREEPYTSMLQQLGVEVLYGDFYKKNWRKWLKDHGDNIDFVYLNRACVSIKYIDFVKKCTDAKITYNAVDFSYLREQRQYEVSGDKQFLIAAENSKKLEFDMFKKSDVIITISEYEKDLLKEEMPKKKIHVIPTFIYDESRYGLTGGFFDRKDITFVGGFNHKPNVDGILWFVNEVFPGLREILPSIKLNVVGSNPPSEVLELNADDINVTGFVSDEELKKYYECSRLVIAPLRFGAGVKGKIIEAIFYGTPVVTTKVGAEGIKEGEDIVSVGENEDQFMENIVKIYNSEREWRRISSNETKYAKKFYNLEVAREVIEKIYS